eukprot:5610803-Ditylum_brightwellii.AAC.1
MKTGDMDLAPYTINVNIVVEALASLTGYVRKSNSMRRCGGCHNEDYYNYDQENKHKDDQNNL